jgi:hypothetical protein
MPSVLLSMISTLQDHRPYPGTILRDSIEFWQPEHSSLNVLVALPATLIGVLNGLLAAAFTAANLRGIALRKAVVNVSALRRVIEPMLVMVCVVALSVAVSALFPCARPVVHTLPSLLPSITPTHCPLSSHAIPPSVLPDGVSPS